MIDLAGKSSQWYWAGATLAFPVIFTFDYSILFLTAALLAGLTDLAGGLEAPLASIPALLISALVAFVLFRNRFAAARGVALGALVAGIMIVVVGIVIGIGSGEVLEESR
ncbi:hypothetical protein [Nocardia cyriacigeorgica]|uniref:hypothetical protein n=1 Tax=Nocardia cyriacigeorgica TaxID=135487 RepID=UPI00056AAB06|nr:hypothetical protein [Nocardia cyriacigeorgica]TLF60791.1 hypothetical protein FEK31_03565 [Nocardia cyriacigeorgica]